MIPTPMAEVLFVVGAAFLAAWVLSYLLHSTVVCLGAIAITRTWSVGAGDRATMWRFVLLAPLVSASMTAVGLSQAMPLTIDVSEHVPQVLVDWRVGMFGLVPLLVVPFVLFAGLKAGHTLLRQVFGKRRRAPAVLQDEAALLASAVGCRVPRVTLSEAAGVPAAIGLSEICMPAALYASAPADERRALIAHEMGHLKRRDPLWFMVAGSLVRLTAFQPLNRIAMSRLREASEDAADDVAVEATGNPVALARGLARLATAIVALSGGAAASGSPVVARVSRLLDGHRGPTPPRRRSTGVALATLALTIVVWFGPGVSANPELVADRLPWLASSKEEPNPRMLEVRRILRAWRDAINRAF